MRQLFLLIIAVLGMAGPAAFAQQPVGNFDEALAAQYFQQGDWDKAALLYKKLLDASPSNNYYYDNWSTSLINLKRYDELAKEIKKLQRKRPNAINLAIDLGYALNEAGKADEAKKEWDNVVNALGPNEVLLDGAAAAFIRRGQPGYAIAAYRRGAAALGDPTAYSAEIIGIYAEAGNNSAMVEEFLAAVDNSPFASEGLRDLMQDAVQKDEVYDLLRKGLLRRIQQRPDQDQYSELLSWLFMQRKDFASAYAQMKALDKRRKEGGKQLVYLARVVSDAGDYALAETILNDVILLGNAAPYYYEANRQLLDLRYAKVTQSGKYTQADVDLLASEYEAYLAKNSLGNTASSDVALKLADIYAQYAGKPQTAIDLLKNLLLSRPPKPVEARAKLALGDYSLLTNDLWEATLYYGQVEKMYKDDILGSEAKFRNARLSFYRGEFEWAKAQLNVLKGSTTELIANDALQLATLIQDNLGLDSTEEPMRLYAEASFLIQQNLHSQARLKLDSIGGIYPSHSLSDEILMARGAMAFKERRYAEADSFYSAVVAKFGTDILGDDALFRSAELHDRYLDDPEGAKVRYEKLILNYPGSVYGVKARARFRSLRGDGGS